LLVNAYFLQQNSGLCVKNFDYIGGGKVIGFHSMKTNLGEIFVSLSLIGIYFATKAQRHKGSLSITDKTH